MKKSAILISLALLSGGVDASAQKAFENLSFGVELGTNGIGVELAMPVITNRVVFVAGFNAPTLAYPMVETEDLGELNAEIDKINSNLASHAIADRVNTRFSDITISATPMLNLSTAKLLLELYPFENASLHITAGAYFGMGDDFISVEMASDQKFWSDYQALQSEIDGFNAKYGADGTTPVPGYEDHNLSLPAFALGDKTFEIGEKNDAAHLKAAVQVNKIRPYLGIGFGRSVPKKHHWGLQLELGVLYQGNPMIVSDNIVESTSAQTIDLLKDVPARYLELLDQHKVFWPHASLKLVYKIF